MKTFKNFTLTSILLLICLTSAFAQRNLFADSSFDVSVNIEKHSLLKSPNSQISLKAYLKNGIPQYKVSRNGKLLIDDSTLSISIKDTPFTGGFKLLETSNSSHDSTWSPVWGKFSHIRNNYNQTTLHLQEIGPKKRKMNIVFRAFDDGVAFRYVFPDQPNLDKYTISAENTEFNFTADHTAWFPSHKWGVEITGPVPVSKVGDQKIVTTPMTIQTDDCFLAIHEAQLDNYSTMFLSPIPGKTALKSKLVKRVSAQAPNKTPWRVIMIADKPGKLLESNILLNLNDPSAINDTSWIKPGKSLWDWRVYGATVEGFTYARNTESVKRLIDFASASGLNYMMIDAGWYGPEHKASSDPLTCIPAIDVPYLANYAKQKNVGLWAYINDVALKKYDLDKTLSTYKDWGIVGIKHGFLCNPTQAGINFCHKVVKKCAQYKLMYDGHESIKPSGFERTYPNFIAREYNHSLADGKRISDPGYIVKMTFVNMLAGPLDHTPGVFDINSFVNRDRVFGELKSTVAAQTARCLVIYSPFLCLPDHGEAYTKKADLFEFIQKLPMNWDETRILNAMIGKYITTARRKNDQWFIASITDENPRTLDVPLDFLAPGSYTASIYADAKDAHYISNREAYTVETISVNSTDTIKAKLAPGGGHSIWIRPAVE